MKKLSHYQKTLENFHLSKSTIRVYLAAVYTYYILYKDVSAECLDGYKKYLETRYSPRTANLYIVGMNRYLRYLGKGELKLPTKRLRQKNFLDDIIAYEDYLKLKRQLVIDGNLKWYYLIWTLASTGVRVSELLQLKVGCIPQGHADICSKGDKVRRVYLPIVLQQELLLWTSGRQDLSESVFLNDKGRPISIRGVSKGLERIAIRYGLDKHQMHPHAFRHLFAKKFLESKGSISMLADLLGHESLDTTKIYLRMSSKEQQQIIDDIVRW